MRPRLLLLVAITSATPALAQSPPPAHTPTAHAAPATSHPATRHAQPPVVRPPHSGAAMRAAPPGAAPAPATAAAAAAAGAAGAAAPEAAPTAAPAPDQTKGASNLPLPRWASMRTDDVNMRTGPGSQYPIEWVYKRRDLPVRITREFGNWRLVADQEDIKGWVNQATLVGHRSFVVVGGERVLRDGPRDDAGAVARLAVGVVGRIRACAAQAAWCEVSVGEYRGWLPRAAFWGTEPGEAVQ